VNASANGQSGSPVKGSATGCVPSFTRCDAGVTARCFAFGATGGGANGADRVVLVDCAVAVVCKEESGGVPGATAVAVSSVVAEALVVVVVMVVL
jgi:hypothetical protein